VLTRIRRIGQNQQARQAPTQCVTATEPPIDIAGTETCSLGVKGEGWERGADRFAYF